MHGWSRIPSHLHRRGWRGSWQVYDVIGLMTSNRLNFLRSVSIFAGTPDEVLAEISAVLEEVHFTAGARIFAKGDLGDCLYIIAAGQVRVHDDERTLNMLGAGDIFGEMSALDPEVRSASITAVKDTHLFRLGRAPLFQVMASHVEVAQGIIQVLSQRLRTSLRDMNDDFQYMQQFAKLTAAAAAIEDGIYEPESLDEVAERPDALGQLARVFQHMERAVSAREQRLKQQVAALSIEIDNAKQMRQVAEITETEYFQHLRSKAHELRAQE
jgi:CRP/FNR family cyclic AMP-dependent transcriptional regulator